MNLRRPLALPSLTLLGLVACGEAGGNGATDESAVTATDTPSSMPPPASSPSSLVGSGGIVTIPSSGPTAPSTTTNLPGGPAPVATPVGTPTASATASGEPSPSSSGSAGSGSEEPVGAGGEPVASAGAGGTPSMSPSGGSGGGLVAGAGGTSSEPEGPPTFQRPEGTIPNAPQPESVVDLNRDDWQSGLVSPTLDEGTQINQPAVVNGYLLVTGNEEFWFYDVSDPTAPERLSHFTTPNRRAGGEAEGHTVSFARYGDRFYMVTINGRGIDTWDIGDVRAPHHLAHVPIAGTNYGDYTEAVWGVAWQGQYIYVGATNNGIKVVDAEDPAAPQVVAEVPTSQYGGVSAGPVEAVGNVLVVMTPKESGGVATLDISDPTNPTRLASFTTQMSYIGQFYRRWVFLITPLRAWDVLSDPRNIGSGSSPLGTLNHEGAEYISFQDDYLFLGHVRTEISGTPGASKITVANPGSMRVESRVWGRLDRGGLNDDQFNIAFGNLLVLGDDQAPYAGWVIAAHDTDPDTTPPVVDTVIPKDGESGVSTKSRIGISFSDNIELATVDGASFEVRPVGGAPLAGKYGSRMGVLNFDPDEDLEPGTTYEVVLRAGGLTDLVGNALEAEWKSTFTTN